MAYESPSPGRQQGMSRSKSSGVAAPLDAADGNRSIIEERAAQSEAQRALATPLYDASS